MKKLFTLLLSVSILALSSCSGGWTEEQLQTVENNCEMKGGYDCDCYVEKVKKNFKNPKDYNKKDSKAYKKFEKEIKGCEEAEEEAETQELESF